jgi:hypothetical protein
MSDAAMQSLGNGRRGASDAVRAAVKKGLTLARYLDYIDQENTSADLR